MKLIVGIIMTVLGCLQSISLVAVSTATELQAAKKVDCFSYSKLIIAANVSVILYAADDSASMRIEGESMYLKNIHVLRQDCRIMIIAKDDKDLINKITVYVPYNKSKKLGYKSSFINCCGRILRLPELNLVIGGRCAIKFIRDDATIVITEKTSFP